MIGYLEYLNVPTKIGLAIVALFCAMQIVGEFLEFKGQVVPEFVKIRKYFDRKAQERKKLNEVFDTLDEVKLSFQQFSSHYSDESIKKRDTWIKNVNRKLEQNDILIKELSKKMDKNNQDTLSLLIDSKRNTIINFASVVLDEKNPITREQFNRIFKLYEEYENIIESNGLTNGEVDIAIRMIKESYEDHMKRHSFVEDIRGYDY